MNKVPDLFIKLFVAQPTTSKQLKGN